MLALKKPMTTASAQGIHVQIACQLTLQSLRYAPGLFIHSMSVMLSSFENEPDFVGREPAVQPVIIFPLRVSAWLVVVILYWHRALHRPV